MVPCSNLRKFLLHSTLPSCFPVTPSWGSSLPWCLLPDLASASSGWSCFFSKEVPFWVLPPREDTGSQKSQGWCAEVAPHPLTPLPYFRMDDRDTHIMPEKAAYSPRTTTASGGKVVIFFISLLISRLRFYFFLTLLNKITKKQKHCVLTALAN